MDQVNFQIRNRLRELGLKPTSSEEIETLGLELTLCQFIVVVLSLISVIFLFVPLFFLRNTQFMIIFFTASVIFLAFGIWFWTNKAEICEHPELYDH